MTALNAQPLCIVLNNQHQVRLDEYISIHKTTPNRVALFQPYTDKHLRQVYEVLKTSTGPIPIFLIVGNYGETVKAVGLLHSLEYRDVMLEERKQDLYQIKSKYDDDLYALNILSVTNLLLFRDAMPVNAFSKKSDGKPLEPGQWTASICYSPSIKEIIQAL